MSASRGALARPRARRSSRVSPSGAVPFKRQNGPPVRGGPSVPIHADQDFLLSSPRSSKSASTTSSSGADGAGVRPGRGAGVGLGLRLVDRLAELHRRLGQVLGAGADLLRIVLLHRLLQRLDRQLDRLDRGRVDLVAVLGHRLLGAVDQALGLRSCASTSSRRALSASAFSSASLTILSMSASERPPEAWMVIFCSLLVPLSLALTRDDAVGVDVEGHLDLRHAARRRRDRLEVELAEQLVVGRHLALALEDPDRHRVLVVLGGGEDLALLGRDRGVAVDQPGEDAAQRLDAERERRHVEQHHVLDVALQHAGLDRRAERHHLVGVDALVRLLAEELGHLLDDLRHAGHAADQHHLVDVGLGDAGVLQRVPGRASSSARSGRRPGSRAWRGSASAPGAAAGGSSGPSR